MGERMGLFVPGLVLLLVTLLFEVGCRNEGPLEAALPENATELARAAAASCDKEDLLGCEMLANYMIQGQGGLPKQPDEGVDLLVIACTGGAQSACSNAVRQGEAAFGWLKGDVARGSAFGLALRKSCDAGGMDDCLFLGLLLESGTIRAPEAINSTDVLRKACEGGAKRACDIMKHKIKPTRESLMAQWESDLMTYGVAHEVFLIPTHPRPSWRGFKKVADGKYQHKSRPNWSDFTSYSSVGEVSVIASTVEEADSDVFPYEGQVDYTFSLVLHNGGREELGRNRNTYIFGAKTQKWKAKGE